MSIAILRAIVAVAFLTVLPAPALAQLYVGIGINSPPPPIPVYTQPLLETPNLIWTPGYWAWGSGGYYWVPGTWVPAPSVGLMWTPGYWAFNNGAYYWTDGFWAPRVGFYGGINYDFGYFGIGFVGGQWSGNVFRYNTAVVNVDRRVVRNIYIDRTVINKTIIDRDRISYNGGEGGVHWRATADQLALRQRGIPPTTVQRENERYAAEDRDRLATVNGGRPLRAAVERPLSRQNHPAYVTRLTEADRIAARRLIVRRPP